MDLADSLSNSEDTWTTKHT